RRRANAWNSGRHKSRKGFLRLYEVRSFDKDPEAFGPSHRMEIRMKKTFWTLIITLFVTCGPLAAASGAKKDSASKPQTDEQKELQIMQQLVEMGWLKVDVKNASFFKNMLMTGVEHLFIK